MSKGSGVNCRNSVSLTKDDTMTITHTDKELLKDLDKETLAELNKKWIEASIGDQRFAAKAASKLNVDLVTAIRLEKENFQGTTYHQYKRFLYPSKEDLVKEDYMIVHMQEGADYLVKEIKSNNKIAIFTDYDIDGTSASFILNETLTKLGSNQILQGFASAKDGFGLTNEFVDKAINFKAKTLIVLDCGSTQTNEIVYAKSKGLKVIIIDHHNVDPDNPADYYLNPRYLQLIKKEENDLLSAQAKELLKESTKVKREWLKAKENNKDITEVQAELDKYIKASNKMIQKLDKITKPIQPSNKLQNAIDRLNSKNWWIMDENLNTASQLTWKFAYAMLNSDENDITDDKEFLYQKSLYMGGLGAIADMGDMRSIENRAFARVAVDNYDNAVPKGIYKLAQLLEEDPLKPAHLIRTRAALNLSKRTPLVDGETIYDIYTETDDKKLDKKVQALYNIYTKASEIKDEMVQAAISQVKENDKLNKKYFAYSILNDYIDWVGQSGVVSQKLVREFGKPAVTFTEKGVDKDGNKIYKFSARNGIIKKAKIGKLLENKDLMAACTLKEENQNGDLIDVVSLGGHEDVVSGSCTEKNIKKVIKEFENFGEEFVNKTKNEWTPRIYNDIWVNKRLVSADTFKVLEKEGDLFQPVCNKARELDCSVAVKFKEIQELNKEKNSHQAVMEFEDGTTRNCLLAPNIINAAKIDTFFEAKLRFTNPESYYINNLNVI